MASNELQPGETPTLSSASSHMRSAIAEEIRTRIRALSTERSDPPVWAMLQLAQTVDQRMLLSRIRDEIKCLVVPEGSPLEIEKPVLHTMQENNTLQRCLQALSSLGRTSSSREEMDIIEKFSNAIQLLDSQIGELETRSFQTITKQQNKSLALSEADTSIMYLLFLVHKLDENRTYWNETESNNIVCEMERLVDSCKKIKQEVQLLEALEGPIPGDLAVDSLEAILEKLPDDHESVPSVREAIDSIQRLGVLFDQFLQREPEAFVFQRIKDLRIDMGTVTRVVTTLRNTGIASTLARMSARAVLEQDGLHEIVDALQASLTTDEDMHKIVDYCVTILCSVVREGDEGAMALMSIAGALETVIAASKDCTFPMQVAPKVVELLSMIAEYEPCRAAIATDEFTQFLEFVVNQCHPRVDEELEQTARTCLARLLQYQVGA